MDAAFTFNDLLGLKAPAAAKKGAMKAPSGKAAQFGHAAARSMHRMGVVRQITAHHLADGRPLLLEMQVRGLTNVHQCHFVHAALPGPASSLTYI
jgi:hypothetical protein